MGFVHPFEMEPNYVSLINETLCPNRRGTVEQWSESTLCRKKLMKFSEGIHLPGAGLGQRNIQPPTPFLVSLFPFSSYVCLTIPCKIYFAYLMMDFCVYSVI